MNKKNIIITSLIGIVIIILSIIIFNFTFDKKEKSDMITFNLNFNNEIFMAEVDENYIDVKIQDENILLFKPKDESEHSYISIIAQTKKSTSDECLKLLKDFRTSLEEQGIKTNLINESINKNIAFLTYTMFDSDGDIVTVYAKSSSNENYTTMTTLYQYYSKTEKTNIALKNAFDSFIIK